MYLQFVLIFKNVYDVFFSLEGFQVVELKEVISTADIIVTCTGQLLLHLLTRAYIFYLKFVELSIC